MVFRTITLILLLAISNLTIGCPIAHSERLYGVDTILVEALESVSCKHTITITEGIRTKERQAELVSKGKSWAFEPKHITGKAVDIYLGTWEIEPYRLLCTDLRAYNPKIICGVDWKVLDGVHFEIPQ